VTTASISNQSNTPANNQTSKHPQQPQQHQKAQHNHGKTASKQAQQHQKAPNHGNTPSKQPQPPIWVCVFLFHTSPLSFFFLSSLFSFSTKAFTLAAQ
jgi:hypothetical protein